MKKNNFNKIYIIGLVLLVALFLALIALSTAFKNVSENYTFEENVNINEVTQSSKIGEVTLRNDGVITSKINLKPYLGCVFLDDMEYDFYLDYVGANDVYYGGYRQAYVELSVNEEKKLNIVMNSIRPYLLEKGNEPVFPEQVALEIYEADENYDAYYEQCSNIDRSTVVSKVNLNIIKSE